MTVLRPLALDQAGLGDRLQPTDLQLEPGHCVVLAGPNGAGKSTLLRLLAGLETPTCGKARLAGRSLHDYPRRELAGQIGWLPQRPLLSEGITTEEVVALARFRLGEPQDQAEEHARQVLREIGARSLIGRHTNQISGGELQRVLIASLVAQEAPYLLVDEPANHLDPRHQIATYQRLGKMWRETGCAVAVVTHDIRLARLLGPPEAVRIAGVRAGRLMMLESLASPTLATSLADLYGVHFVPTGNPGELAVDFSRVEDLT